MHTPLAPCAHQEHSGFARHGAQERCTLHMPRRPIMAMRPCIAVFFWGSMFSKLKCSPLLSECRRGFFRASMLPSRRGSDSIGGGSFRDGSASSSVLTRSLTAPTTPGTGSPTLSHPCMRRCVSSATLSTAVPRNTTGIVFRSDILLRAFFFAAVSVPVPPQPPHALTAGSCNDKTPCVPPLRNGTGSGWRGRSTVMDPPCVAL